jgi:hypothetical protein
MSSKILKVIFVVLFVVLLGEVGYFFYSSRNQVTPSLTKEIETVPVPTVIKRNGKKAVDDRTIEQIKNFNSGVLKKSILQNTYSGKIIEIATNGNNLNNNIHYGFMIRLMGDNDETNTFYYNDEEVEKIKVLKVGSQKALTIADLKKEDSVVIDETLDMTQDLDHNLVSHTISIK